LIDSRTAMQHPLTVRGLLQRQQDLGSCARTHDRPAVSQRRPTCQPTSHNRDNSASGGPPQLYKTPFMLPSSLHIGDVVQAIQLALAPVFLLTGIAGMLNVMAGRLARIIDRGRQLLENPVLAAQQARPGFVREIESLERRRHLASAAITACTFSALSVCMVIMAFFLEVLVQVELRWLIALLFMGSTLTLVVGLAYFLREVHLATTTVRIAVPTTDSSDPAPT
jgi:Protein of unknown function (DUF2721)